VPESAVAQDETARVAESLVAHGAPLAGVRAQAHWGVEETIVRALALSRADAIVFRVLPVVLARHASSIEWSRLRSAAEARGVARELGLLVDLVAEATGRHALSEQVADLVPVAAAPEPWFAVRNRFHAELLALESPPAARRWGFLLNVTCESVRAMVEKHGAALRTA